MIAALNLIPLALLALAAWSVWKKSRAGLIGVVLLAAVYAVVQPSYLPKGTVERSPVPFRCPHRRPQPQAHAHRGARPADAGGRAQGAGFQAIPLKQFGAS